MRRSLAVVPCIAPLIGAGAAWGQNAGFDGFAEGFFATVITENGLTFRDLDQRIPGSPPPNTMAIEDASQTLAGMAGFTSPNVMDFGGYSPGPGCSFGRIGSLRILPPGPRSGAAVEVYELGSNTQNTIALVALLAGQEVGRMTVTIPQQFVIQHSQLRISGTTFDELRIIGAGPGDSGCFFGAIDSVAVTQGDCYANCDASTTPPVLNVNDFNCFLNRFAAGDSYANCDGSTTPPVLNVNDFNCFLNRFAAGCG